MYVTFSHNWERELAQNAQVQGKDQREGFDVNKVNLPKLVEGIRIAHRHSKIH